MNGVGRDIAAGLYGAFRLALADKSGLALIENSTRAFWRSFWAAAFIAPFYLYYIWSDFDPEQHEAVRYLTVNWLVYAVGWGMFPLFMFYVSELLDRTAEYKRFIIAYNWAAVLQAVFLFAMTMVAALDIVPDATMSFIRFMSLLVVLAYIGYIARVSLQITPFLCFGLVMSDFMISLFLNITALVLS